MTEKEQALSLLERIGLNRYESKTYAALLRRDNATAGEIAELASVPRSRVYDVLTSLEKKGFAVAQLGRPVRYKHITPENAINNLKEKHRKKHEDKLDALDNIGGQIKKELSVEEMTGAISPGEAVSIIRGKSNVYNHIKQLIDTSSKSVIKLTNDSGLENLNRYCANSIKNANDRGVEMRIAAKIGKKVDTGNMRKHTKIKKVDGPDGRFVVKDEDEAILVTIHSEKSDDVGLMIKSPYLASYLRELFEHAWEKGEFLAE